MGSIYLILGPVKSGKSTYLIKLVCEARLKGKRVLLIKPDLDTRSTTIYSRTGITASSISSPNVLDVLPKMKDFDAICIDEAQFFPDLLTGCMALRDMGKMVIVAGLDSTWQRVPFPSDGKTSNPLDLVPHATKVKKCLALCHACGEPAIYSCKTASSNAIVIIGGDEAFLPVCHNCYV